LIGYLNRRLGRRIGGLSNLRYPSAGISSYYQYIHQTNDAYKENNWLMDDIDAILSANPMSVLEVGCGNGRFIAAIQGLVPHVLGVDWAESPILTQLGVLSKFKKCDITRDALPSADMVCSADVLEHIAPDLLPATLRRLHEAGNEQYHVIACYDDGHSHLTIMDPHMWLRAFRSFSDRYILVGCRHRRGDQSQMVCIIATFTPKSEPVALASLK
jgi:SAM-dependent methyltransferase